MSQHAIIITAGGSGRRMGAATPKQFLPLGNEVVLMRTIRQFHKANPEMLRVLTLPEKEIPFWKTLCAEKNFDIEHELVAGGETRYHSILNALKTLKGIDLVGVHDGVRPFASEDLIRACFAEAEKSKAAIPVKEVRFSLRKQTEVGSVSISRKGFLEVQTPQVFNYPKLMDAYAKGYQEKFTDDASVWEANGGQVSLVEGEANNLKITLPEDLDWARYLASKTDDLA